MRDHAARLEIVTVYVVAQVGARGVVTHSLLEGWKMDPGGLWGGCTAFALYCSGGARN